MADKQRKGVSDEAKQTRLLVVAGLVLAALVFMFYTKGALRDRDTANQALAVKIVARDHAENDLRVYQNDPAAIKNILERLANVESAIPYYDNADPTPDLVLSLPGSLSDALTKAGINFEALPVPQVLGSLANAPENTGAVGMNIQIVCSIDKLKEMLGNLEEAGLFVTVSSVTYRETQQAQNEDAVFDPSGRLAFEISLRFWFATVPPFGTKTTTTQAVAAQTTPAPSLPSAPLPASPTTTSP